MKDGISDNIYIQKILKGDTNAYAVLVNKYKQMVFSVSVRILRNNEDAEESAQDTFLKAYNYLNEYNGKASFSTWLYRIAYTSAISKLRMKKTNIRTESIDTDNFDIEEPVWVDNSLNLLEADEQRKYIDLALEKLEETESLILSLFYLDGCSVSEISEITNLSRSNIKVILFRSRKKLLIILKKLLKEEINILV
ncbi:MAG: sigma-70 family RNA polymerase sigma factor [Ignavibacteriae bacterium]|nr:sigma-70 family RNA polymerase sigma factor [Ignavibacteriota bacterium]